MSKTRMESDWYEVHSLKMDYGLLLNPSESDTIEHVREAIDRYNKRAIEKGYNAERYNICHKEWYRWKADDGSFLKDETILQLVEVYPEKL